MDIAQDTAPAATAAPAATGLPESARGYRGVLRTIAGSVDEDCEAALDYVLVRHGTQGGSSYAPTEVSDARELDEALHAVALSYPRAPKGMSAEEASATLDAIGAFEMMAARRAQLLADGYSASLTRGPHYVTVTVSREGRLFPGERHASLGAERPSCIGTCTCGSAADGGAPAASFCTISLTLAVRGSGCVAAITSPGAWEGFHTEEILVPEIFMAGNAGPIPPAFYPQLVDARARGRYREQITRVFARFLVLAFTAFDGRLVSYLRRRAAPGSGLAAADTTR